MESLALNWVVGVITCPRDTPTLKATLDSLERAGWPYAGVLHDKAKDGCYRTWRKLGTLLCDLPCDYVLMCEDDLQITTGLRAHLEQGMPQGVVSLYTGAVNHGEPGWNQVTKLPKNCHGALATIWTPDLLKTFLQYDRSGEFRNGTDTLIGMWCRNSGIPYWTHTPSFVRHTGVTSAIDPSWDTAQSQYRQCKEWLPSV